mgnify:CR=1 FL=1
MTVFFIFKHSPPLPICHGTLPYNVAHLTD